MIGLPELLLLLPVVLVLLTRPRAEQPRFALSNCSIPRLLGTVPYAVMAILLLRDVFDAPRWADQGRVAQVTVIAVALIVMGFYVLFGRSLRSPKIRAAPVPDNPTQFGEHLLRFNGSQWECARCGALRQRTGQFEIVKCVGADADITTTA